METPKFAQWAEHLGGLVLKVGDEAVETAERAAHEVGFCARFDDPRRPGRASKGGASGCEQNFEGEARAPVLLPAGELAPFVNPVFWGNFSSVDINEAQIHGGDGGGWQGTGIENFLVGCRGRGIEVRNVLDLDFQQGGDGGRATFTLRKALTGGFTVDQGYMAAAPRELGGLQASWLIGQKTINLDPTSKLGGVICLLPYDWVQALLKFWLHITLLEYSFRVMERARGAGFSKAAQRLFDRRLDGYHQALAELGFDPAAGKLTGLPATG